MPLVRDELDGLRMALQERITSDFDMVLARHRTHQKRSRWAVGLVTVTVVATAAAVPSLLSSDRRNSGSTLATSGPTYKPTAGSFATVNGYSQIADPSGTRNTTGPVPVSLSRNDATRLAHLVGTLPKAPRPFCIEPPIMIYKISFNDGSGSLSGKTVTGYECAAAVSIRKQGGQITDWRRDAGCQLFDDVKRLLPPSARGTATATVGCK